MKINISRLSRDMGGSYFLNRVSLALVTPFLIVFSMLSWGNLNTGPGEVDQTKLLQYFGLLLANILSLLLCWIYIEIADRVLFRTKTQKPIAALWVLLFGATLGFLKGFTTGWFSWLLGSDSSLEFAISSRVYQTTVLGIWSIPLLAIVAATVARYESERQLWLSEKIQQSLGNIENSLSSETVATLEQAIASSKQDLRQMASKNSVQPTNPLIAQKLRDLVDQVIRPLSYEIWNGGQQAKISRSIWENATLYLRKRPFPLRVITVGLIVGQISLNLSSYLWQEAITRTLILSFSATVLFALAKIVRPISQAATLSWFFLVNLIVAISTPVITELAHGSSPSYNLVPIWIALFLWLIQLSFFASIASEILTSRSQIRQQLIELIGSEGIDLEVKTAIAKLNTRELAQYVHGNIQNRILSFASKLEQNSDHNQETLADLVDLENFLDSVLSDFMAVSIRPLAEQLLDLENRWAGFLELQKTLELGNFKPSSFQSKVIMQVVSEAVSNSVRHGLAKTVFIRVEHATSEGNEILRMTIEDDGLGPRTGKKGLGAELFDAVSGRNWSMSASPLGGTRLLLVLSA